MVNEVESILNEIRERVRTEEKQREAAVAVATQNGKDSNPAISPAAPAAATESLARLEAHLTTTSRAWNRLPPMFSNRSGAAARFELWIKARLKSLSRSEEHTSELQSRVDLVCRLLLEKKKHHITDLEAQ